MANDQDARNAGSSQSSENVKKGGSDDRSAHASRTSGTDRDFDESGESANQGHGHPREERGEGGTSRQ